MPWQTKTATPHQTPNEPSPAIVVSHVTMQFKRAKDEATSLKELLVRTLRRQDVYKRQALKGYLSQEGLLEDRTDAIVDSGWTGSMQMVLNEVLSHICLLYTSSFAVSSP